MLASGAAIDLMKFLEDSLQCLGRNTDPCIGYCDCNLCSTSFRADLDRAIFCELNCITKKISQNLAEPILVSNQSRQIRTHVLQQLDFLTLEHRFDCLQALGYKRFEVETYWSHLDPAG